MRRDPYLVLGIPPTSSLHEVKAAYHKLAKIYHPDKLNATEEDSQRFKDITAAYQTITERQKIRDQLRQRTPFSPQQDHTVNAPFGSFRSTFGSSRGGQAHSKTTDPPFPSSFADLLNRKRRTDQKASGSPPPQTRPGGNDDTLRRASESATVGSSYIVLEVRFVEAMMGCKKTVTHPSGREFRLSVPAGCTDRQPLKISASRINSGLADRTAPKDTGDLVVEVRVKPHQHFVRHGQDIHLDVPISLREAVLGGRIEVPSLDGAVALSIPPGTSSGKKMRLRGRGVGANGKHKRGDFYITLLIIIPAQPGEELRTFAQRQPEDSHALRTHLIDSD